MADPTPNREDLTMPLYPIPRCGVCGKPQFKVGFKPWMTCVACMPVESEKIAQQMQKHREHKRKLGIEWLKSCIEAAFTSKQEGETR